MRSPASDIRPTPNPHNAPVTAGRFGRARATSHAGMARAGTENVVVIAMQSRIHGTTVSDETSTGTADGKLIARKVPQATATRADRAIPDSSRPGTASRNAAARTTNPAAVSSGE